MCRQPGYLQSMLFGWLTTALLFMAVSNGAAEKWEVISQLLALPVSAQSQLLTTIWGKLKK